jgi:uncharacterized coiled-coil DUF342 family protein
LSVQLREARDRTNRLEREADELGEQFLVEARAIIQDVQSNADAAVKRTIREADERIARLTAEAENQFGVGDGSKPNPPFASYVSFHQQRT